VPFTGPTRRSKLSGYSITSSAMASSEGGTSMPRARYFQIFDELEFGCLYHRQVVRLCARPNLI
jgi:hypothetical protein